MINYPNLRPIEDQNRQLELLRKISRLLTIEKDLAYLLTQIGEWLFSAISRQLKIANSLDSYSLQMTSLRASKVEKFSYLSLLRFPADWRNRLREAVNVADFDMVDELLKQVAHMDSEVRPVLEELAHRFAAEEILELLNDAENQNSPK